VPFSELDLETLLSTLAARAPATRALAFLRTEDGALVATRLAEGQSADALVALWNVAQSLLHGEKDPGGLPTALRTVAVGREGSEAAGHELILLRDDTLCIVQPWGEQLLLLVICESARTLQQALDASRGLLALHRGGRPVTS
jgi:hypothetical protein